MAKKPTNPPRSPVVVKTVDGQRLKPPCPICGAVSWGRPIPPEHKGAEKIETAIMTRINDGQWEGMGVQVWACLNCGHIWHRSGAIEQALGEDE